MRQLKDLTLAVQRALKDVPAAETKELEQALDAAVDFLSNTKSYEYSGEITCDGSIVKLADAKIDFDDVLKMLVDKKSGIKVLGEVYLMVYPEKSAPAAAAAA